MKAYIYWLHLPEHTDMKIEGYIGVARDHNKRFKQHKRWQRNNPHLQSAFLKYGDRIVKHIIWLGEEDDCYKNEEILRPEPDIGWNLNKGGDKPPDLREHKPDSKVRLKGNERTESQKSGDKRTVAAQMERIVNQTHNWQDKEKARERNLKRVKDGTHHFLGESNPIHRSQDYICPQCGLAGRGPNMKRYHFDNCKLKGN